MTQFGIPRMRRVMRRTDSQRQVGHGVIGTEQREAFMAVKLAMFTSFKIVSKFLIVSRRML